MQKKDIYLINLQKHFLSYLKKNKIKKIVIGISGGIDSAVSLAILSEILNPKDIYAYFIDIESSKKDYIDAKLVCDYLKVQLNNIDLNKSFNQMIKDLNIKKTDIQQKANLKSRLRMTSLYNFAFKNNAIVIGNSNLNELYVGYFTKYGDNCCDYALLAGLLKKDIYNYAKYYNLPKSIINKAPSSGLIKDLTDEQELGLSYTSMDNFLSAKKCDKNTVTKIEKLHNKNKHKLIYNRYVNKSSKYRNL